MSLQIRRLTGAEPTATNVTSINTRLNAEDAHSTAGTTNPILKPASGTNYSYWASFRLYYDGAGTGTINNIRWFTDGTNSFGTGRTMSVGTATAYAQATGTPGETGDVLNDTNYSTFTLGNANAFTYTSASPLAVTGSVTDPSSEEFGHYVVIQKEIDDTASAGAGGAQETISWRVDSTIA